MARTLSLRELEELAQFDMAERGRRLTAFREATKEKVEVTLITGETRFVSRARAERLARRGLLVDYTPRYGVRGGGV